MRTLLALLAGAVLGAAAARAVRAGATDRPTRPLSSGSDEGPVRVDVSAIADAPR